MISPPAMFRQSEIDVVFVAYIIVRGWDPHHLAVKLANHSLLFGLGVDVGPLLVGGAVLHDDLALFDLVLYVKNTSP
jgi:hypothetical protein